MPIENARENDWKLRYDRVEQNSDTDWIVLVRGTTFYAYLPTYAGEPHSLIIFWSERAPSRILQWCTDDAGCICQTCSFGTTKHRIISIYALQPIETAPPFSKGRGESRQKREVRQWRTE